MERDSTPRPLDPDPEIAALLDFEPVRRKCRRHDGWTAEIQRGFVAALVEVGNAERAAQAVGRTASGAYKARTSAGGGPFGEAWDKALALYHLRNPRPVRVGRPSGGERRLYSSDAPEFASAAEEDAFKLEIFDRILEKYVRKLDQERSARLDGRIIEADYCVRQLTYMEICLDLGGRALDVLSQLQRGGLSTTRIAATPLSLYLDWVRRLYWQERDEPERPPLAGFGWRNDEVAGAEQNHYSFAEHGPEDEWKRRREAERAVAAEAQRLWEEKAEADAEAWAARLKEAEEAEDEAEAEEGDEESDEESDAGGGGEPEPWP